MKKFNKIAIVGVGLIGGSVGLAIKKKDAAKEVVGVFRHSSTLKKALKYKAVDKGSMNIRDGVRDADLVILATPVSAIVRIGLEVAKAVKKGAIVTDVGSTKACIVNCLERVFKSSPAKFVGSHPMAGSEHNGVEFAREDLLEGSPCIITRTAGTDASALKKVTAFWKSLGAKIGVMSPSQHDRSVAMISHLPHIVGFSLAGAMQERDLKYAAEGFKDTTRVASSDPSLWADIFLTNKKEALKACRTFEESYRGIVRALSKDDHRGIVKALAKAKAKRDKFIYGAKA